jgi:hypothetical protein
MYVGVFDDELVTVDIMNTYLEQNGQVNYMNEEKLYYEFYLSAVRKMVPKNGK